MKKFYCFLLGCLLFNIPMAFASVYIDANLGGDTTYNSMAYNTDIGYLFNRYLGLEGGVTFSGSSDVANSTYTLYDGAVKGILPLTGGVSVFGKLGAGMCTGCDQDGVGALFGGGFEFDLNRNWSLQLQDFTMSNAGAPNFVLFGGEFKFR